ncbi:MAG TPA: hypothetical protein VNT79_06490 [Phycisphaerae bacterium]|nr:hypothetical protein [Phycisphaerae bacterium]
MNPRAVPGLLLLLNLALCACNDSDKSKRSIQPARTYASPTAKSADRERRISRPIGCGGHPYYYDYTNEAWLYYDAAGVAQPSPGQPPCPGADLILKHFPEPLANSGTEKTVAD